MTNIADAAASQPAIKILLVEDSLPNRDMLTRRLQSRGFVVCSAEDGPTGVAMAASEMPNLILMDVALGAMDGWEATRQIKTAGDNQTVPVIALTAHAMSGDRERAIAVGCAEYHTKPVDFPKLLAQIEALLHAATSQGPTQS